jgi:hypothetical protein
MYVFFIHMLKKLKDRKISVTFSASQKSVEILRRQSAKLGIPASKILNWLIETRGTSLYFSSARELRVQ